jgi:hypothetical protein
MNMYMAIRNFAILNEKIASLIPKFWDSYQLLLKIIQEIQLTSELQGLNRTGLTLDKNKLKNSLIAMAVKYSNKVSIYARLNNNDTLLKEVKMSESDFSRLSGLIILEKAQLVYDKTEANLDKLADQGINAETQKKFLETLKAYNDLLSMPRTSSAERKRETQKLPGLFANADLQVNIMDMAASSAKGEYPDFYNGYKASRQLVDTSSGSLALKASAREAISGAPVSGAKFTFKPESGGNGSGNGEIIKKTSKKGNFQMKSMVPGGYKVLITGKGYINKEVSLNVTDGERSELVVELEKA